MESLLLYEIDPSETSKTLANNIIRCLEGQVCRMNDLQSKYRMLTDTATKLRLKRIPGSQRSLVERERAL
jgi:hypothetical protein